MLPLSPQICRSIALTLSTGDSHRRDLAALCLTCKALQREATPHLYARLAFADPAPCLAACRTLTSTPPDQLGTHVRTFAFNPDPLLAHTSAVPRAFWEALQAAFAVMPNLEMLVLSDFAFAHSWVLDPGAGADPAFQLKDARLRLPCDAHLLRFLHTQTSLRALQLYGGLEDPAPVADAASAEPEASALPPLPALQVFDGPLLLGARLLSGCSAGQLRHVQLVVDCERTSAVPLLRGVVQTLRGTLQSVNVLDLHGEDTGLEVLSMLCGAIDGLRHVGVFAYPMVGRYQFHKHLIRHGPSLRSIELDLTRWNPPPTPPASQRMLADELRTFCPALRVVIFWVGRARVRWEVHRSGRDGEGGGAEWEQWVSRVEGEVGEGEAWNSGS
ncbi:hypothetical protein BJ912DRAFT_853283 [Pholiota molesta]|nr:hypothetical protein BJ912DRAFT_853283 [Pholiota molesta]